jgi:glycosyltransferase involved in cell wall biosynthesis
MKYSVTFFHRKPGRGHFSLETYFDIIRKELPHTVRSKVVYSTFFSRGLFKRVYNVVDAAFKQSDVNHITGDIHYIACFLKKRKTILTILDCGHFQYLKGLKLSVFKYFWYTLPAKKSRYITTISEATKQDFLKHVNYNPDDVKVIPICISPLFKRIDKKFNKDNPRILQLGTAFNKNIQRLAAALEGINCELVIVGKLSNEVVNSLEENRIKYTNLDRSLTDIEIIDEYKKADIVTLISTLEGFGMPIIEANAVGRVAITGNITSMPEVAGDAAHIVDPFSVSEMHEGFLKIINDEAYRSQLIENGFKNTARYQKETIVKQYLTLYDSISNN